jgi:hypothetical protein
VEASDQPAVNTAATVTATLAPPRWRLKGAGYAPNGFSTLDKSVEVRKYQLAFLLLFRQLSLFQAL